MIFTPQNLVYVYYNGRPEKILVGKLLLKNRKIFFEYDNEFIKTKLELSPFKLPIQSGLIESPDYTFERLFGVFNDSLPDGWGRLLLDRKLMSMQLNPGQLSPLDRLCLVGSRGMGALSYEPENPEFTNLEHNDLDEIYGEIIDFEKNQSYDNLDDLIALNGSSAGARPKIVINIDGKDWLIKFRSSLDTEDIGNIEYAYNLMAKESGLWIPDIKLFPSRKCSGYFGVKRFDRKDLEKIHIHTIAGLLHADHREPCLDYQEIMKATMLLTNDIIECKKQFRNAVFNVLSHNRDDHSKNFSYMMDSQGIWSVSPAYDLTFSSGPRGEHSTMVMGEGKNPTLDHLLDLAQIVGVKESEAREIIEEVIAATSKWENFANIAGVSKSSAHMIKSTLGNIRKNFE